MEELTDSTESSTLLKLWKKNRIFRLIKDQLIWSFFICIFLSRYPDSKKFSVYRCANANSDRYCFISQISPMRYCLETRLTRAGCRFDKTASPSRWMGVAQCAFGERFMGLQISIQHSIMLWTFSLFKRSSTSIYGNSGNMEGRMNPRNAFSIRCFGGSNL